MPVIKSYFRIDGDFVPVDQFSGSAPDAHYIEGAIVCRIDGCEIFKTEYWDLVYQLWAYIVEGLQKLDEGQSYEAYFPDQPLRLRFEPVSSHCVKFSIGDESTQVDAATFRSVMKRGAVEFFSRMKEICPEAIETWERYQKAAEMVRS